MARGMKQELNKNNIMGYGGSKMLARVKARKAKRAKRIVVGTGPAGTVFKTSKPKTKA